VIFGALAWEIGPVLAALDQVRSDPFPGFPSWRACAGEVAVRVVRTGIGAVRAEAAARLACGEGARVFLGTGCAGGLSPGLAPGDLVCATSVVNAAGHPVAASSTRRGVALRRWAASRGLMLHAGCCVTVTEPLGTVSGKLEANRTLGAIAVDMEAAAIGSVAAATGVEFVGVRAILDPVDMAIPDLGATRDAGGEPSFVRPLVAHVLRNPGVLPEIARLAAMRRAARAALEHFFRVFVDEGGAAVLGAPAAMG
jgi:adenosylhomocysteine nucleosidase